MTRRATTIACMAIGSAVGLPILWASASAQDLGIGISQGLSVIQNDDLEEDGGDRTTRANTNVSLSLSDATRDQSLSFGTGLSLQAENDPGSDDDDTTFEVTSPSANLSYTRSGPGSGFSLGASFSRVQIDTLERVGDLTLDDAGLPIVPGQTDADPNDPVPDDEEADPGTEGDAGLGGDGIVVPEDIEFEEGEGTRQRIGLSTGLQIRQGTPLAFSFRASGSKTTYEDTTNSDLDDNRRLSLGATSRMIISPTHTLTLGVNHGIYDEDGQDTQRTTGVNAGFSFGQPAVSYSVSIGGSLDENDDFRTNLSVGFSRDLQRGSIGATIGATQGEEGDPDLIGTLNAGYQVPFGQFSAQASRSVSRLNDEDEDEVVTVVSGQFSRPLSPRTNVGVNASFVQTRQVDADDPDRDAAIGVNFNRQLSPAWSFSAGARQVFSETADDEWVTSERVFFNVGRQFGYRF